MVCIYCGHTTKVTNSRLQKRRNSVWRRRQCTSCDATFTSIEQIAYEQSLSFEIRMSHIVPFERDALFLSLYESCRHRASAVTDASSLTDTVLQKLLSGSSIQGGIVKRPEVIRIASEVLRNFDAAAATYYQAYHQTAMTS